MTVKLRTFLPLALGGMVLGTGCSSSPYGSFNGGGAGDGGDGVASAEPLGSGAAGPADGGYEFPGEVAYSLPPNFDRDEGRCPLPDARKLFGGLDFTLDDAGHPKPSHVLDELSAQYRIPYESGRFLVEFRIGEGPYDAIPGYDTLINGIQVSVVNVVDNRVRAWIAVEDLLGLAEHTPVRAIAPPRRPRPSESEGVGLIEADVLHASALAGAGIRIAVLDEGFEDWDTQQQDGQVPAPVYAETFRANQLIYTETNHGTAVAEIVRDVAPDAEIAIAAFDDFLGYMEAIDWAVDEAAADVILTTVGHVETEPLDGTGMLARTANEAAALGAMVVSAAGNRGDRHYRASFSPSLPLPWGRVHDFGGAFANDLHILLNVSDQTGIPQMVPAGAEFCVDLVWEDWGPDPDNPNSSEDYDLYIWQSSDLYSWHTPALGNNLQDGNGQSPIEQVCAQMQSDAYLAAMVVEVSTTQDHNFQLFSEFQNLDGLVRTPEYSLTTPCVGEDVICVGATSLSDDLQDYSGQGPTIPPTGFDKPELFAPDCVANETQGGPFCGTSASTPHVAGVAALYLQAYGGDSEAARDTLLAQALPVGPNGQYDRVRAACVDDDSDGYTICDGDCDDSDPAVHPYAPDPCNDGIDSDCDGTDGADHDMDGCNTCDGDCNDNDPALNCDDVDADGWTTCDGDCNDFGSETYPGAQEICDLQDNDCNGALPDDEVDADGEGIPICGGDCDDTDATVYPGAPELCDAQDNDCDGHRDENLLTCPGYAVDDPFGFDSGLSPFGEVVLYTDSLGDIHAMYKPPGLGWQTVTLSLTLNLPAAVGTPHAWTSIGTPLGDIPHLVFRAVDGDVYEVWCDAGAQGLDAQSCSVNNLSALTGAPAAASDPVGYFVRTPGEESEHVTYQSEWGAAVELYFVYGGQSGWVQSDLTAASGAPAGPDGAVDAWFTDFALADCQNVVYRSADGRIRQLWNCWYAGANDWDGWHHNDLTGLTDAPLMVSDPSGYYSSAPCAEAEHVLARDENGHVWEHYMLWDHVNVGNNEWFASNLSTLFTPYADPATAGPSGWYSPRANQPGQHGLYSAGGDLWEMYYDWSAQTPGWALSQLTYWNPPVVGTPMGYYILDSERVVYRDSDGNVGLMYYMYDLPGGWLYSNLTDLLD